MADLLVHQLANHNAMAHYDFRGDLLRSLEMFERNRALLGSQPGTVDLEAEFRRVTGLSPRQFIELCLVVGTPYRMMNAGSLISDDPTFFVDRNRFANMKISDAEPTSFFGTVAQTAQQLAEYLPTRGERPLADTTVFQSWPVIQVDGAERYYCCDVASLMDKTGRGLYWTLFGAADVRTKSKLGGTYGRAFEAYLHDCVQRAGFAADSYVDSPKFSDGAEVCDGLFIDGSHIILCEYKSSVLTAEAKLSGRLDLLEPDLRKKFVTGDAEGRKGIAQLSRSIDRLLTGEPVTGLPSRNWSLLQPVMVCLEDAMLCPGMSRHLNDQFDRTPLNKRSRIRVAPLTLIDIQHFEDLLPDMKAFGFGTLLEDYYRSHMRSAGGGHDQLVAFRRKNISFLDDKPERVDEKEAAFRRFLLNWVPGFSAKPRGPTKDPCVIRGRTRYAKRLRPSHAAAPIFVRHLAASRASWTSEAAKTSPRIDSAFSAKKNTVGLAVGQRACVMNVPPRPPRSTQRAAPAKGGLRYSGSWRDAYQPNDRDDSHGDRGRRRDPRERHTRDARFDSAGL